MSSVASRRIHEGDKVREPLHPLVDPSHSFPHLIQAAIRHRQMMRAGVSLSSSTASDGVGYGAPA